MTPSSRQDATNRFENPIPHANPGGGGLVVAGVVAALAIGGVMLLSKKKTEAKPALPGGQIGPIDPGDIQPCPIDAVKLTTWAASKGIFAIYGATLQQAPDYSTVLSAFNLKPAQLPSAGGAAVVVVTATGGFFNYPNPDGHPVAAPTLRDSYCKYQTVPVLPAPPSTRNAQSSLSGQTLYSPTFL